jgi:hypothetical protein
VCIVCVEFQSVKSRRATRPHDASSVFAGLVSRLKANREERRAAAKAKQDQDQDAHLNRRVIDPKLALKFGRAWMRADTMQPDRAKAVERWLLLTHMHVLEVRERESPRSSDDVNLVLLRNIWDVGFDVQNKGQVNSLAHFLNP